MIPTCFVIAPEDPAGTPGPSGAVSAPSRSALFREEVVRPVCEQFGLALLPAVPLPRVATDAVLRHLVEADVVVADLTGSSPEVAYALGVRHAVKRPAIQLREAGTAPHGSELFPAVEFPGLSAGVPAARRELAAALMAVVSAPVGGPVGGGAAPEPGWPPRPGADGGDAPGRGGDGPQEAAEAPGYFDLAVAAEAEMEAVTGDMAAMEAAMADLAAISELYGGDLVTAGRPGKPMSAQLTVINRFAKAIEGPSDELQAAAVAMAERMDVAIGAMGAFLRWFGETPRDEWPAGVDDQLDEVIALGREIRESTDGLREVLPMLEMLGSVSRRLRGPSRKIGASLRTLFGRVSVFEEWEVTARALKER
ncbi:hypothetical protein ACGH2B_00720 [Streptomyces sp. BBFR2]|uniref:hypothetical protein n=1 Tax=Streptomyces sp. BBFR2 TaxID=3372854 RepID=UPI0037D99763